MSERMPRVTGPEVVRALERAGWQRIRQEGSRVRLHLPARLGRVTVPVHHCTMVPLSTLGSILNQAGMTVAELKELL